LVSTEPARAIRRLRPDLARQISGQSVTRTACAARRCRAPVRLAELTLTALLRLSLSPCPRGRARRHTRPARGLDPVRYRFHHRGRRCPTFFTGILLVYVFYYLLGWSPSPTGRLDSLFPTPPRATSLYLLDSLIPRDLETFRACLRQLALPAVTMALFVMAPLARMTRASMLGVLGSDFIRTARASGLSPRTVLWTYGFRTPCSGGDHSRHDLLPHAGGQRAG
jgi:peptide/nickel transport system permease protein